MKSLILTLFAQLLSHQLHAVPYKYSVHASKTIPFVIIVEKDSYAALLKQLPSTEVSINREAIVERLERRLRNEKIIPQGEQTLKSIATELYQHSVEPILKPRVEKFNDLINRAQSDDSVSAGYIAFAGLAKSMAKRTESHSSVIVMGQYSYLEGQFDETGTWEWDTDESGMAHMSDITRFSANLNAEIDEAISFNLKPYGKDHSFTWNFNCSGEVKAEQQFVCDIPQPNRFTSGPSNKLQITPEAKVVVTKEISSDSNFRLSGEHYSRVEQSFSHPATMEVELTVKKHSEER